MSTLFLAKNLKSFVDLKSYCVCCCNFNTEAKNLYNFEYATKIKVALKSSGFQQNKMHLNVILISIFYLYFFSHN
jgi:hypothetical protein